MDEWVENGAGSAFSIPMGKDPTPKATAKKAPGNFLRKGSRAPAVSAADSPKSGMFCVRQSHVRGSGAILFLEQSSACTFLLSSLHTLRLTKATDKLTVDSI